MFLVCTPINIKIGTNNTTHKPIVKTENIYPAISYLKLKIIVSEPLSRLNSIIAPIAPRTIKNIKKNTINA